MADDIPIYNRTPLDDVNANSFPAGKKAYDVLELPIGSPIDMTASIDVNSDILQVMPVEGDTTYSDALESYYNEQVVLYGTLNNRHEENYVYSDGREENNVYNGILSHVIRDFDNDGALEMALFRIKTDSFYGYANKEILLDIIKLLNGKAVLIESLVIDSEAYDGEEIECLAGIKKVNDVWRIYLNYYSHKVLENIHTSKFVSIEYNNTINIISEINYTGADDDIDIEMWYDYENQVMDTGLVIKEETNIYKRAFLNDDVDVKPIFVIKRVNESMREGFIDEYLNTHFDELSKNGLLKVRYGYTTFIDRVS